VAELSKKKKNKKRKKKKKKKKSSVPRKRSPYALQGKEGGVRSRVATQWQKEKWLLGRRPDFLWVGEKRKEKIRLRDSCQTKRGKTAQLKRADLRGGQEGVGS